LWAIERKIIMMRILVLTLAFLSSGLVHAQKLKAYQIYNKKGDPVTFKDMTDRLAQKYDVVLFGEFHNNAIIHWLELQTAKTLYQKKGKRLIMGAEMFERDNQPEVDAYLSDSIDAAELEERARLWKNFKTDYKPLLNFAKTNKLPFVATNIPRRDAQLVAKNGLDTLENLSREEKAYMAKMPIKFSLKTPGYKEMKTFMKEHADDHLMDFIKAQAVKDATMAESIYKNRARGELFLHFNGNYHSKDYGGIYWYLKKEKKFLQRLRTAVITVAESSDPDLAIPKTVKSTEYIIVVPKDMTKTY